MNNKASLKADLGNKIIAAGIILAGWYLLTLIFPPVVFPSISSVGDRLWQIVISPELYRTIALTIGRLAAGLSVGIVLGCIVGALMGASPRLRGILSPIISLLQSIPPVSWVVMALIWFGFNGKPAMFIIMAATLPIMAINIAEGFKQMDRRYLEMAHVYRFTRRKKLQHIVLPSLFPFFHSALRIALGGGWKVAVMAEVLTTSDGIGGMIKTARLNIETESVVAWSAIVVILFYLSDGLLALCFRSKKERENVATNRS